MQHIPYVYVIQDIETKIKYIGSRRVIGCNPSDLLVTYFTSSMIVNQIIDRFGSERFEILEIYKCESPQEAVDLETKMLLDRNAIKSDEYYNISNQGKNFHVSNHMWITNGNTEMYIQKNQDIPNGWVKGRKKFNLKSYEHLKNKRSKKMNKDGITTSVYIEDVEKYKLNGWVIGDLSSSAKKSKWINNGIESKYVNIDEEIPIGWTKGRLSTANNVTEITKAKLWGAKSIPIQTEHFCAISISALRQLYIENYNVDISEYILYKSYKITKKLLTERPDIASLFSLDTKCVGKTFSELGKIQRVPGITWKY